MSLHRQPRIMIVDDDPTIRDSFQDYLEDYGMDVTVAESGEQALHRVEADAPDVMIVDIRMGGMSGDQLISVLYQKYPRCGFVICTGSPEYTPPEFFASLPRVADEVLRKPVAQMESLRLTIEHMLTSLTTDQ